MFVCVCVCVCVWCVCGVGGGGGCNQTTCFFILLGKIMINCHIVITHHLAFFKGSQYELKDSAGVHPGSFAAHTSPAFYPYGQFQYGDPARPKNATRESTSTLKAWLNEHRKNPYPTKGEKIMLAIITKMTLTQVSTWFANARRRLKKENKVTWGRSKEDGEENLFGSGDEAEKNEDEEEIDLESIDIDKIDDNDGDQSNEDDDDKSTEGSREHRGGVGAGGELDSLEKRRAFALQAHEAFDKSKSTISVHAGSKESSDGNNNNTTRVLSPDRSGSFPLPSNNKPKIWSLAETATSPDSSSQKPSSPCGPRSHHSPVSPPPPDPNPPGLPPQPRTVHLPDWKVPQLDERGFPGPELPAQRAVVSGSKPAPSPPPQPPLADPAAAAAADVGGGVPGSSCSSAQQ